MSGATVTLTSDKGGTFTQTSGTTDSNGYFTASLTAPTVATQTSVKITVNATKTGYLSGESQAYVAIDPILENRNQPGSNLWIYIAIVVTVLIAVGGGTLVVKRRRH